MLDPKGVKIEVRLEAGCPTVDLSTAKRLIKELEDRGPGDGDGQENASAEGSGWLTDLRKMWPEVPDELLARVVECRRASSAQPAPEEETAE